MYYSKFLINYNILFSAELMKMHMCKSFRISCETPCILKTNTFLICFYVLLYLCLLKIEYINTILKISFPRTFCSTLSSARTSDTRYNQRTPDL